MVFNFKIINRLINSVFFMTLIVCNNGIAADFSGFNVLYYRDFVIGSDAIRAMMDANNVNYTFTTDDTFATNLNNPNSYNLVIYNAQGGGVSPINQAALSSYILSGGRAFGTTWYDESGFLSLFGATTLGASGSNNSTSITGSHAIFNGIAMPLALSNSAWGTFQLSVQSTDLSQYEVIGTTPAGDAFIIKSITGKTYFISVLNDSFLDLNDGIQLYYNLLASFNFGPSAADTLSSMNPNAYALRGAFIQQSAIINNGLNYDCTTFDVNGICVSAGGRVTDANNPATNSQGALLIASYRANDNWRIGGYLDQNLSSNDPRGVNLDNNNPMGGVFAVWNQNTDGTGYQVRVAAGYSDKDLTISRTAIGTAEAGKGDSSLRSQAYSATLSHGFQLNDSRWIASPYLGVRYTKIKRASYTEETTSDVTTPLSYSRLSQETTTALAGVRFNGQLAERVNVMASAGVESDIAHNTGDYAATGVDGLTPIEFNQNIRHVRPVATAGVSYAIDKRQVVSANLMYRQEAFNSSNSTTGMVTYQVGF